jgi:hypothetical protein
VALPTTGPFVTIVPYDNHEKNAAQKHEQRDGPALIDFVWYAIFPRSKVNGVPINAARVA